MKINYQNNTGPQKKTAIIVPCFNESQRLQPRNFTNYAPIIFLAAFLFLLILSILVLSWVPPVSKDALSHHLTVPKLYLIHGGIYEIPAVVYSYYPMNLDLLYLASLYFGSDIAPKYIHFTFAILTAYLIFRYLKKWTGIAYALLGAVIFLSIPVIVKLSITVYVDLGLIFFSFAALLSFFKWIETDFKVKYLLLSAVCSGLALGTKYNALIALLLLALFVPFIYARKTLQISGQKTGGDPESESLRKQRVTAVQIKAMGYGTVFALISLLIFSPWMLKNFIWTNNPVYPLFDTWFNPPAVRATVDSNSFSRQDSVKAPVPLSHFSKRAINYNESWWQIALVPVRIFFQGRDGDPRYFDGRLTPFLFFLPMCAFFFQKSNCYDLNVEKTILLVFSVLFLLLVFFQIEMRIRWVSPVIPPLVILSVLGLNGIENFFSVRDFKHAGKIGVGVVLLITSSMIAVHAGYVFEQFRYVDPISYITGRIGRDEYIEKFRHEYPTLRYANKTLPQEARILSMFLGNRYYYSDREMIFNEYIFRKAVVRARSSQEISSILGKEGITHLLVRYDLFVEWSQGNFNNRQKDLIKKYFKEKVRLLFSKNGYGLYELKSSTWP